MHPENVKSSSRAKNTFPHTVLLAKQEELKELIEMILPAIERMLDDRNMSGNLSETRMRSIVNSNEQSMYDKIDELKKLIKGRLAPATARTAQGAGQHEPRMVRHNLFQSGPFYLWLIDGALRRVPPDWEFPKGAILNMYRLWHHGDEVRKISPLKFLERKDLNWKREARWIKSLSDCRKVCKKIDDEAKAKGFLTDNPKRNEVVQAFYKVKYVFGLSETTPKGRKRNFTKLTLGTVIRELSRQKKRRTQEIEDDQSSDILDYLFLFF